VHGPAVLAVGGSGGGSCSYGMFAQVCSSVRLTRMQIYTRFTQGKLVDWSTCRGLGGGGLENHNHLEPNLRGLRLRPLYHWHYETTQKNLTVMQATEPASSRRTETGKRPSPAPDMTDPAVLALAGTPLPVSRCALTPAPSSPPNPRPHSSASTMATCQRVQCAGQR
jgi:hypothetical protein